MEGQEGDKMPLILLMGPFPCPRQAVEEVAPVAGMQLLVYSVRERPWVSDQPRAGLTQLSGSTGCVQPCAELIFLVQ